MSDSIMVEEEPVKVPTISIQSSLKKLPIPLDNLERDAKLLLKIINVEEFGLEIYFVGAKKMRSINKEWREKDKSTDVISFPMMEMKAPEQFLYNREDFAGHILGEIIFELEYIKKRMFKDQMYFEEHGKYDDETDAGVSKVLARTFDLNERVSLLLIHSILHLVGYDHETEEDFEVMTKKEEEVIQRFYEIRESLKESEPNSRLN